MARALRDHGQASRTFHDHIGYNYRMDGFQGAILRVKMTRLEAWTARRREIVAIYEKLLATSGVARLREDVRGESVHHLFVVYIKNRDAVRAALERRGVETAIHYPKPVHLQKAYSWLGHRPGSFPDTEHACDRVLSLPMFPEMTNEQAEYVATVLADIVEAK